MMKRLILIEFLHVFVGVKQISVALMAAKAEVMYDASHVLPSQIANAISDLGFACEVIDDYNAGQGEVVLHVSFEKYEVSKCFVLKLVCILIGLKL